MKKILLDEKTQILLRDLARTIGEAQTQMTLACNVYLNSKGVQGNYSLSADCTALIKTKDKI